MMTIQTPEMIALLTEAERLRRDYRQASPKLRAEIERQREALRGRLRDMRLTQPAPLPELATDWHAIAVGLAVVATILGALAALLR